MTSSLDAKALSLTEPDTAAEGGKLTLLNDARAFPLKTEAFAFCPNPQGDDKQVDVVVTSYADRLQIIITDDVVSKPKSVFNVRKDRPRLKKDDGASSEFIYTVDLALGTETEELLVFARVLAQALDLNKPLTLAVGLENPREPVGSAAVKSLTQFIEDRF